MSLLRSVYPHHPWKLETLVVRSKGYLLKRENQREFMEYLFKKFGLCNLDDWFSISKSKLIENGGWKLLKLYSYDFTLLLNSLYPNYPYKHITFDLLNAKFRNLRELYCIFEKKDWYRITKNEFESILPLLPASEKWNSSLLHSKNKKTKQRLLFSSALRLFRPHLVLENYKHPHLHPLELDIFIPSLHLAIEYQGEQHFDEIPAVYSSVLAKQSFDEEKIRLCGKYHIHLLCIPYWWDYSSSSCLQLAIKDLLSH
jgi:hypothetical protein